MDESYRMEEYPYILKWFGGKAQDKIRDFVVPQVNQGLADDRWPKGASRPCRATLNKLSGATKKVAKAARTLAEAAPFEHHKPPGQPIVKNCWNVIYTAMMYGVVDARLKQAVEFLRQKVKGCGRRLIEAHDMPLAPALSPGGEVVEPSQVVDQAEQFYLDFAPVYEAMNYLDTLRPAPVFVMGGTISATVKQTLLDRGLNPLTVRYPEMQRVKVKCRDKHGKEYTAVMLKILWPANTVHFRTRFSRESGDVTRAGNLQCNACGHAIRNGFNWVPLLIDDAQGVPHSMWVGCDCAHNLFGCDMKGEAEYLNGILQMAGGQS